VRDWLLGLRATPDLDITVEGHGLELARAVSRALGGAATEHQQFGTATVVIQRTAHGRRHTAGGGRNLRVDFATCRRETYARPAAYPKVAVGTLRDDLLRRDFTINAMAVGIGPAAFGTLVDPSGGRRDLAQRRLRVLHPQSFEDDPSRILRGVRLACRFDLRWEPATRRAAVGAVAAGLFARLNAGRVSKELALMAQERDPRACFTALASLFGEAARAW